MANIITCCRILCSILLLFVPAFSSTFYILYLVAGFTDMIDGPIARKTNTANEFGSRLDTIADMVFAAEHTVMNKITGFMLFILPFTLPFIDLTYSGGLVCAAAIFAAVQEGHLIRKNVKCD